MSKRKPLGVSSLIKKLDRIFSVYVRLKHSDSSGTCTCITCGRLMHWKDAHAGHFIKRQHQSVRYDERNVHPQCPADNVYKGGCQDEYAAYVLNTYGHDALTDLLRLKRQTKKWTRTELEELIAKYKAQSAEYEGRRYEL
jgi:hypothetical protein